jgi:hypothetical protein
MKQACCCQAQLTASANRGFEFDKRGQFFSRTHNETLSVAAMRVRNPNCSPARMAIKERSARNSESEVNSNRSVSLGRQGRLDYVNFGTYVSPHLSRCPKFF